MFYRSSGSRTSNQSVKGGRCEVIVGDKITGTHHGDRGIIKIIRSFE